MRNFILFTIAVICTLQSRSQNVGIGTTAPKSSAALDISSNDKGLLIPRTSTVGRTGIAVPAKGLMVYDTTAAAFYYYDGGKWNIIGNQNYDNLLTDYSASPQVIHNMGVESNTTAMSGILYDNGGPAGSYANNSSGDYEVTHADNDSLIGYKVTVEEMDLESPYDYLEIYIQENYSSKIVLTGNTTGTYYFSSPDKYSSISQHYSLVFAFNSNAANTRPGFKVKWTALTKSSSVIENPPLYGLYFNQPKTALRGGIPKSNEWATDSLGAFSFAYGSGAKATGKFATAFGKNVEASGNLSIALGDGAVASGNTAIAIGSGSKASANFSTAIGFVAEALGSTSVSIGNRTRAEGEVSNAFGYNVISRGFAATAMGMYNDTILAAGQTNVNNYTPLFIIGNGNAYNDRSNAIVVLKNGNVSIGNNPNPVNRLHITGGTDLDLTDNSGFMTIGGEGGTNMVFDNNEIQVRNNATAANMFLQGNGGNVMIGGGGGIGPDQKLSVNGSASKTGGGSWATWSDMRLKQNIRPYTDGLSSLLQIEPVWYQYNAASGLGADTKYVGVIAQQLQQVSPYMVTQSKNNTASDGTGYLSVDNSAMTYMLINAVKEQQGIIEALKKRIEILENAIEK